MTNPDPFQLGAQVAALLSEASRKRRRDLFAAHAMQGLLARPVAEGEDDPSFGFIAEAAFRMADFMLTQDDETEESDHG